MTLFIDNERDMRSKTLKKIDKFSFPKKILEIKNFKDDLDCQTKVNNTKSAM